MISRRGFISALAALGAAEAIPLGRVWFFPKKIRLANIRDPRVRLYNPFTDRMPGQIDLLDYGKSVTFTAKELEYKLIRTHHFGISFDDIENFLAFTRGRGEVKYQLACK